MTALVERVQDLVDEARARLGGPLRAELDGIRADLDEPLRVVVAGRVSSGKSTLVNALLGRRVAPKGGTETTKVVTRFRFDRRGESAELVLRDGERRPVAFENGMLPRTLDVEPQLVRSLEVGLTIDNGILGPMMLIDTPGLDSLTGVSQATEELLAGDADATSREAMAGADALVFMLNEDQRADELGVIQSFLRDRRSQPDRPDQGARR
jgi:predicted GTPase